MWVARVREIKFGEQRLAAYVHARDDVVRAAREPRDVFGPPTEHRHDGGEDWFVPLHVSGSRHKQVLI